VDALGAAIRHEWTLDWNKLTVNHGSYGATPRVVLEAQQAWRDKLEQQPTLFMRRILPGALRASAEALGRFVGADGRDIAFVDNATTGCNAVLRSLALAPGDEILVLSHVYGAVRNTARYVAERSGARLVEAEISFPNPDPGAIVANVAAALSERTRIAVIDHISSHSALVLPLAEIIAVCRKAGVPILVDGAHAPGQVDLDHAALGADWYTGNCHKWLLAPKGCAFLFARRDRQDGLHPVTISHGYGQGFAAEFDWTGTRDPSAYLSVDAAIAFHNRLGGPALRARNAALARRAAEIVAQHLGTDLGAPPALCAAMALVRLPPLSGPATPDDALRLRGRILEVGCDAPLFCLAGSLWLRVSAQAYNQEADYERLAALVAAAWQAERKGSKQPA
jgi:isopenicillin-N epimerase